MSEPQAYNNVGLRSLVTPDGTLRLSLEREPVPAPGVDQVVVRIGAAPLNPSDLGLLLAGADPSAAEFGGTQESPVVTARVPPATMPGLSARLGQALPVGNEAAGSVVAAGASPAAQALIGKTVGMFGGAMFAHYRVIDASECLVLLEGTSAEDGASSFVNPMTALAMLSTMRREGHTALVHTAAASNLGQMLVRLCLAEGVQLVNIVRSAEQASLLRDLGAVHICDSTSSSFREDLIAAVAATGATLAFDAIGGGALSGQILSCMEAAARRRAASYSRYGSDVHKQVYVYGGLDPSPSTLVRDYGMAWGIGGWLLMPRLGRLEAAEVAAMRERVAAGLKDVFASRYTRTISLADTLSPHIMQAYAKRATGEKYLISMTQV